MKCVIDSPIANRTLAILNRQLNARGCAAIVPVDSLPSDEACLRLTVDSTLAPEAFRIRMIYTGQLDVAGGSGLGLLFGIGKMLRTASFADGLFTVGPWRGTSEPRCSLRCVYLATHFHNFYHSAPVENVLEYIEDLALWGFNCIGVWPDKHHFDGIDSPDFQAFLARLKTMLVAAKDMGMQVCLLTLTNEGYRTTPKTLVATHPGRSFYGCEICPSTPGGMELILRNHQDTLDYFSDIAIDYFSLWSYDQGGCGCEACAPWGAAGMLDCGREVAALVRQRHSACRIIYSTWLFNYKGEKEWEGLDAALAVGKGDWIDVILAESHGEYPRYPLEHQLPGNKPIVNFPEISMRLVYPWGGSGTNPMHRINANIWGQCAAICSGGMLYSEGIFEDINKALYAYFYWNGNNDSEEALREYARFELGCPDEHYAAWRVAVDGLEDNSLFAVFPKGGSEEGYDLSGHDCNSIQYCGAEAWSRSDFKADAGIIHNTIMTIDRTLSAQARSAWRWRLFVLRAIIDDERQRNHGDVNDCCADCFDELRAIYYADEKKTRHCCCPPTRKIMLDRVSLEK